MGSTPRGPPALAHAAMRAISKGESEGSFAKSPKPRAACQIGILRDSTCCRMALAHGLDLFVGRQRHRVDAAGPVTADTARLKDARDVAGPGHFAADRIMRVQGGRHHQSPHTSHQADRPGDELSREPTRRGQHGFDPDDDSTRKSQLARRNVHRELAHLTLPRRPRRPGERVCRARPRRARPQSVRPRPSPSSARNTTRTAPPRAARACTADRAFRWC